ncbi:ribosomal protein L6, bacterial type [Treponema sp. JC4]|jgi:large subunit ribosomal protein L6|uniref:50S ribosomal protein L6 n=1 Tax=unclassified Treponema TaxID=2638727 RepID=UPI00025B06CE|nr:MULTISPECIES: 50S ribosomal protein L6 [unclassified Treponema]EID86384.1 ribosomal protein L6, bacterial type [Treponema sp. JC4]
MSKVGKLPVAIPAGVTVTVANNVMTVKGPKGELKQPFSSNIKIDVQSNEAVLTTLNDTKQAGADHGLYRSLLNNMVKGVSEGFTKTLVITGVGYRAEVKGKELVMNLGYSSDYIVIIPNGVTVATTPDGKVTITGIDKQLVGEFSSQIRKLRKPEPYKGKGIRYDNEVIRRKVGKTGVK